jgi:hypothetical protein
MSDETIRVLGESFKQCEAKIVTGFSVFAEELKDSVRPAMQRLYDELYQDYIDNGAIYDETPDGCYRWLREMAEIAGLQAEADYIENRQWIVADFKRQVALEKRG